MSENQELKDYLDRRFSQEDASLHFIRTDSAERGLDEIQISIYMGKFLYLMAKIQQAKKILEIGTLGGYSTAWLARALDLEGKLISLEMHPSHVKIAREHMVKVQVNDQVEIREGQAVELLAKISRADEGPFDFFFIDADKENNVLYLDWAIHLSRPGSLIIIDNIIPKGSKVGYPGSEEAIEIYAFNDYLARHPALEVAAIPTLVREHGRLDGLAMARVK